MTQNIETNEPSLRPHHAAVRNGARPRSLVGISVPVSVAVSVLAARHLRLEGAVLQLFLQASLLVPLDLHLPSLLPLLGAKIEGGAGRSGVPPRRTHAPLAAAAVANVIILISRPRGFPAE